MGSFFEQLTFPDRNLFFSAYDPNDQRLGDFVSASRDDFDTANVVILGCPCDEGVIRNRGREGARKAPREIRRWFYRLALNEAIETLSIVDLGDLKIGPTLEETHARLRYVVKEVLQTGKILIVLGGGNDISYADCGALSDVEHNFLVFNIDKHYDVRNVQPRNSGTPYRQLIEEQLIDPTKFFEIGSELYANSIKYKEYLEKKGAKIYELQQIRELGIENIFTNIFKLYDYNAIFWGFDLDSVRSSDAPGVSASYPTGFTAEEIIQIAKIAGNNQKTRIVEFTEVNPEYDLDGRTSKLTAILMHTFLTALGKNHK